MISYNKIVLLSSIEPPVENVETSHTFRYSCSIHIIYSEQREF
jgi:hypothetical protein